MASALSQEDYSEIEQAAYEAAVIPELWPAVLEQVGAISDSAGAALVCVNERGVQIARPPLLDEVCRRVVDEGWMNRSGRAQAVAGKGFVGVPRFVNEYDYFEPGQVETDPIVNQVFRPAGFGWAAGWMIQLPHGDLAVMNVEQFYERGPIQGDALARLDSVYSIFARAATLASRVGFERVRTSIETLEAIGLPAAALTPTSRVVLANDSFAKATHVWTTRGADRLGLHDPVADRMLSESLATIELARRPRSVPVRANPGGLLVAVVQVVPVRRQAHDIFGSTSAIVILSEPKSQGADAMLVQTLFDLTPAEIAVAQAIANGLSTSQISATTGRSITTIRNQLKSAMLKTGSSRQTELALLMRQMSRTLS